MGPSKAVDAFYLQKRRAPISSDFDSLRLLNMKSLGLLTQPSCVEADSTIWTFTSNESFMACFMSQLHPRY